VNQLDVKFKVSVSYALLCLYFFAHSVSVTAQEKNVSVENSDFSVDFAFNTEDGLPSNGVNGVIQDQSGYLWAATFNGLVRYNGISFSVFNAENVPDLDYNRFTSVAEDRDGNIWGGLEYGTLVKITKDSSYIFHIGEEAGSVVTVHSIVQTDREAFWIGTSEGLFFFDGNNFTHRNDLPKNVVQQLFVQDERLYVLFYNHFYELAVDGSEKELLLHIEDGVLEMQSGYKIENGIQDHFLSSVLIEGDELLLSSHGYVLRLFENSHEFLIKREDLDLATIYGLIENENEYFLFGTNGVYKISNFDVDDISAIKISDRRVNAAFFDTENTMWLATVSSGLHQIINTPVYQGDRFEALKSTAVTAILEDSNDNLWVGSNCDGLHRYSNDGHNIFGPNEGIDNYCVWSVAESQDGTIWAGTWGGGVFYKPAGNNQFQPFNSGQTLDEAATLSIYQDNSGAIWFGTHQRGVYKFDGSSTEPVGLNIVNRIPAIRMIYEDSNGNLLFATDRGIGAYVNDEIILFEEYNRLSTQNFRVINRDADERYWFGSYGGGILLRDSDGTFRTLTTENGLLDNTVSQIEFDEAGNVWLAGNLGVFFIDNQEISLFLSDNNHDLKVARLGVNEGLPIRETTGGFMPSSLLNTQGELFIPTVQGLAMVRAERMELNRDLPNVLLENVEVNGVRISPKELSTIPYDAQRIIFSFAALSFKNPEYVQFEYKLDGLDSDWRRLVNSREAIYTTLPVGEYTLRVRASNNHGFWNEEGASVSFSVLPPFWQTPWFLLIVALMLAVTVIGVIRYRVRNIRKYNIQLQNKVDERTAELQVSNQELKKLIDEKNKLHSILAHDLRNPFTSIIGYIDLLRQTFKDAGDKENQEMMELLLDSGKNTLNLLENLLQWSGSKGRGLEPDMEPTDIALLIEEAVKMTDAQASFKNIQVNFEKRSSVFALADRNMILTVIRNLISNAIKFSGAHSSISIDVSERPDDIMVSVTDQGVGMTEGEKKSLFEGYKLTQKLGTQGEKGAGMGLQLCKDFVNIHDGKMWVESQPKVGSTFFFTLKKVSEKEL
jgi:signal transduction histidine kinase/streptogramin lyase